jgi:hypothetical protein
MMDTGPRIRIRIKILWIRNTAFQNIAKIFVAFSWLSGCPVCSTYCTISFPFSYILVPWPIYWIRSDPNLFARSGFFTTSSKSGPDNLCLFKKMSVVKNSGEIPFV